MHPKNELIRVRRTEDGVAYDPSGKGSGRGAYLCKSRTCLEQAKKKKGLERAFSQAIQAQVYQQLEKEIGAIESR
jgi:predicted RNA-binding protein YlxR (DUF448 family)